VRQHVSNRLAYRDVFHSIVEAPLRKIIPGLTLLYLVNCIFFALLWWAASKDCDVGIRNFNNAFIFSTFTIMTIGYGTRDVFFDDCWEASVLIFLESIVSILLDCISLGIVYSHISSGRRRATSILFSDRAVIHRVHGELFFGSRAVWKSTSELGYASGHGDDVASMAWKLHAIEQTQLRRKYRVDGMGRPKFDFHTGSKW